MKTQVQEVNRNIYDIKNKEGGYLLTPNERLLISRVGKYFDKYAYAF